VSLLTLRRLQLRWSYGVRLLSKAVPTDEAESTSPSLDEIGPIGGDAGERSSLRRGDVFGVYNASQDNNQITAQTTKLPPGYMSHRTNTIKGCAQTFQVFPGNLYALPPSDTDVRATSLTDPYVGPGGEDPPKPAWARPPLTFVQRVVRIGRSTWRKGTDFMTPPLWASVLSLVVALIQPLQHLLGVHLRPIRDAITQAGDCSIPLTLVVLGAYFYHPPDKSELPSSESNGQRASLLGNFRKIFSLERWKEDRGTLSQSMRARNRCEGRTVFVSILARMVVAPALLLPLVVFGRLKGYPPVIRECAPLSNNMSNVLISHLHASSPVFILSHVLLIASPPALTLAQVNPFAVWRPAVVG
jgi:predicted permease